MHPNRIEAVQNGSKTFEGQPCKNCSGTERYTVSGGCAACQRLRANKNYVAGSGPRGRMPTERQKALASGETFYEGKPCRNCGGTKRYAKVAICVECSKKNSHKRYHALATLAKAVRGLKK
jgi:hypothetical protein